jgi:signal transduction histidine kinase
VVALANLSLLGIVFLVFIRMEMRQELESFLMAGAREKIVSVARQLTLELAESPKSDRNALLDRYSDAYGLHFFLYGPDGERIAGPEMELPQAVGERMRRFGPRISLRDLPAGAPMFPFRAPPFLIVAGGRYWVGVRMPVPDDSGGASLSIGTLLLQSETFWSNAFFFDLSPWLTILAIAVVVSILCWLPVVRGLTHAITQVMNATAAIAEGHFDVRADTGRRDELGRLGQAINQMAERLRVYLQGQKRFLGDVAHELRSPLGRMQVAIGILERKAEPQERGYLADLKEDVEAMSALTTDLLTFARAEMRPEAVKLSALNLREIVQRAVDAENDAGAGIGIDIDARLRVRGEEKYLTRAFANLVRNAIRYAGADGPIHISAHQIGDRIETKVADSGPGVPEEALEKIFAPFYRPESARDRKTGGTGLGLAIARSSIEACEGSITCRNRQPRGFEAVVMLKAA